MGAIGISLLRAGCVSSCFGERHRRAGHYRAARILYGSAQRGGCFGSINVRESKKEQNDDQACSSWGKRTAHVAPHSGICIHCRQYVAASFSLSSDTCANEKKYSCNFYATLHRQQSPLMGRAHAYKILM